MQKILVANRGEIALRILRTCREMGLKTVAVYSEADRLAPHVRYADQAVCLGPAPSAQSYLRAEAIIEAARALGVDAIHPGYGFLSENADFARAVQAAGLIFIGPNPHAIEVMGSKLAAKEAAQKHQIPLVPGTESAINDPELAKKIAQEIGYPVLIKASAGGGGKGMRLVENPDELPEAMQRAISEAQAAFGDGAVFLEKFVTKPRHIEIQILADQSGKCLYLHERECSIQRRHQKVIEEAPCAVLSPELRQAMGECACRIAQSCQYVGAGTVEFLLDAQHNFYFLEMNTRLQVEHPVTEMITGLDLVEWQIRIARGENLPFKQSEIPLMGHALELRVYAEDPYNNFLPSIGFLQRYRQPQGMGVRVDSGYEEGMEVPIYYDPMLAKLIVHGPDRETAIKRMLRAIEDFEIQGPETTLPFGRFALEHPNFRSADFDTNFVKAHFSPELLNLGQNAQEAALVAQLTAVLWAEHQAKQTGQVNQESTTQAKKANWSPWVLQRRD